MKLDEFRKLLQPMVKDMVKQAILEEGLLSNIVAEVAQGLVLAEARTSPSVDYKKQKSAQNEAVEAARRDLQSTREENKQLFEGTSPAPAGDGRGPMNGVDPNDAGVDIDRLLGGARDWSKLI
jgi:hypothetical protein